MAFTVEDAFLETKDLYHLHLLAGKKGIQNSISWVFQIEDTTIIPHLWGKELAVTMGINFKEPESLFRFIEELISQNASGLIINSGKYIHTIPDSVIQLCDQKQFPLITVPWEILLADLIKDYCIRSFHVENEERQLSDNFITAIENPELVDSYFRPLSKQYNTDGSFQVAVISSTDAEGFTAMRKRRLLFSLQNALDKTDYLYNLFWYHNYYVLILNDIEETKYEELLEDFIAVTSIRFSNLQIRIGLGSLVTGISALSKSYHRADAALHMCQYQKKNLIRFADMGVYQILFSLEDPSLLRELYENTMKPLLLYDQTHNAAYVETLYHYLKCNGSIQSIAEEMYTHRNTVLYRVKKIKELLQNDLTSTQDRFPFEMAFYIRDIL